MNNKVAIKVAPVAVKMNKHFYCWTGKQDTVHRSYKTVSHIVTLEPARVNHSVNI